MKYWENPKAFQERNENIIKDKPNMSNLELCKKYNLSSARIYAIINRHKKSIKFQGIK